MRDSILISKILTEALSCFQQMAQWNQSHNFELTYKYQSRAKALIELVEVHDCGSTGGFSKGQQPKGNDGPIKYEREFYSLYARWLFLAEKYGYDTKGISKDWQTQIKKFFTRK